MLKAWLPLERMSSRITPFLHTAQREVYFS
jgi:hypothetical protein